MGLGVIVIDFLDPFLEFFVNPCFGTGCQASWTIIPGEIFPSFFTLRMFQRALIASFLVSIVAGFLGSFLLLRNMSLLGDGLAHVSFGGVAVGLIIGSLSPVWYALIFSIVASILIDQLQSRDILTGDASIAIFLTGTLGLGLVSLRIWGEGITADVEGYLFGNLLLIDESSFDLILIISLISLVSIFLMYHSLLAISIDPIAAKIQGIPVRSIGIYFSVIIAATVASMVQVVGVLLVTAILVTPSATAQLVAKSFRSCVLWSQFFGILGITIGLYLSAEYYTGSGEMIALVSALIFFSVVLIRMVIGKMFRPVSN